MGATPSLSFVSSAARYAMDVETVLYEVRGTGCVVATLDIVDLNVMPGVLDGLSHHGSVMFGRDAYKRADGCRPEFYGDRR